jgi:electron transfer flavoprotein beta subunit
MKILATVKRVYDTEAKPKLTADGRIDAGAIESKLNPFDEYGVEEAVRLQEKGIAKEVVICCVGPDDAQKEIRTALAMGGDRGILVKVDNVEALDTLAVAKILAGVVKREKPDLVLLGKLATDAENNAVGQMLAELTGLPQGTFAFKVTPDGNGWLLVGREVDGGTSDVKIKLPAVVTADLRLNEPRYASLPGIMKAKKKPLETVTPDQLGVSATPAVRSIGYELPPARKAGIKVGSVDDLVARLRTEAKVL